MNSLRSNLIEYIRDFNVMCETTIFQQVLKNYFGAIRRTICKFWYITANITLYLNIRIVFLKFMHRKIIVSENFSESSIISLTILKVICAYFHWGLIAGILIKCVMFLMKKRNSICCSFMEMKKPFRMSWEKHNLKAIKGSFSYANIFVIELSVGEIQQSFLIFFLVVMP